MLIRLCIYVHLLLSFKIVHKFIITLYYLINIITMQNNFVKILYPLKCYNKFYIILRSYLKLPEFISNM